MEKLTLSALRVNAGLTQEQLAKMIGLSARTLGVYENDPKKLGEAKYSTLRKIADICGCKVDNIFLG